MAVAPSRRVLRPPGPRRLIGFGEAYLTGAWDAEDLGGFLTVLAAGCSTWSPQPLQRLRGARRPQAAAPTSAAGPEHPRQHRAPLRPVQRPLPALPRPVAELLLGALRRRRAAPPADPHDLEVAQRRKIDRLLDQAGVGEGTRVLEIGTGWGELAIRAAAPRRDRHARSRSPPSSRPWPTSGSPPPACPTGSRSSCCDYRDVAGEYDAVRVRRDDRGRRLRVLADLLRDHRPAARARRPGRASRRSRCRTTGCSRPGTPTPGSTSTSSPAASCPRSG